MSKYFLCSCLRTRTSLQTCLAWIPGLRIAITYFISAIFWVQKLELVHWMLILGISNFWSDSLGIFHEFLKMRGWRSYVWVFPSQNRQMSISFYAGHFDISYIESGILIRFCSTHTISTPAIFNFYQFFIPNHICPIASRTI